MAFIESLIEESFLGVLDTNQRSIITDMFAQARLHEEPLLHVIHAYRRTCLAFLCSPPILASCASSESKVSDCTNYSIRRTARKSCPPAKGMVDALLIYRDILTMLPTNSIAFK